MSYHGYSWAYFHMLKYNLYFFSCELFGQVLCLRLLSLDMQFMEVEGEIWHTIQASFSNSSWDGSLLCTKAQYKPAQALPLSICFLCGSLWIFYRSFLYYLALHHCGYRYVFFPYCHFFAVYIFHCVYFTIRITIFVETNISIFSIVGSEFCVTPRKLPYSGYLITLSFFLLQPCLTSLVDVVKIKWGNQWVSALRITQRLQVTQ